MRRAVLKAILAGLVFRVSPVHARERPRVFGVRPSASSITIEVLYDRGTLTWSSDDVAGEVRFDPHNATAIEASVAVDARTFRAAASGASGEAHDPLARKLERYIARLPAIGFALTHVGHARPGVASDGDVRDVLGHLTIFGATHPIQLRVRARHADHRLDIVGGGVVSLATYRADAAVPIPPACEDRLSVRFRLVAEE